MASAEATGGAVVWDKKIEEEGVASQIAEPPPEVAIEVTYLDPSNGQLCKRDVFADPLDWQFTWYKSRLLISSDLVNLLNEATALRQVRSDKAHSTLERVRLGYACDLERIRNVVVNAMSANPASTPTAKGEGTGGSAPQELCPVHFFTTDRYLDQWEIERTREAIEMAEKDVLADIADLQARVKQFGGGSWRQILNHIMQQGNIQPSPLTDILLKFLNPGAEECRALDNELTNGLRDKYDELEIAVHSMDAELADEQKRGPEIEMKSGLQRKRIDDLRDQLTDIRAKLQIPPEREVFDGIVRKKVTQEEAPVFEEVKPQDVGPLFAELLMQWEAKLARIREEIERLKKILAEWQAKLREPNEIDALLKLLREWLEKVDRLKKKCRGLFDKRDRMKEKLDAAMRQLAESTEVEQALAAEVESLPPADPNNMLAAQMRQKLKRIGANSRELLKKIAALKQRIASLRFELRKLYKKLAWEWDMSESEGEEIDDRPYWERRKLAMGGKDPVLASNGKLTYANKDFNPRDFVFAEREYKSKRMKARMAKIRNEVRATLQSQMEAKRYTASDETSRSIALHSDDTEAGRESLRPFSSWGTDTSWHSIDSAAQRVSISREDLGLLPSWAHDAEEVEWRCTQLVQLQDFTTVLTGKLLRSAGSVLEALPMPVAVDAEAPHDSLRERFKSALDDLHRHASTPPALEREEGGGEDSTLASACTAAIALMKEAVAAAGGADAAPALAQFADNFESLARRLRDVRGSERRLRKEMSVLEGRGRDAFGGLRISQKARSASALAAAAAASPSKSGNAMGSSFATTATGGFLGSFTASAKAGSLLTRASGLATATSASPWRAPSKSSGVDEDDQYSFWESASPRSLDETRGQQAPRSAMSRRQRLRKSSPDRDVDLGFRPDGAGEEPLETWSLFKVSKSVDLGSTQLGSTGTSFYSGTPNLGRKTQRIMESTASKAVGVTQGFQEYVAQLKTGNAQQEMWGNSASTPQLTKPQAQKRQPSLPQLITSSGKRANARGAVAGTSMATTSSGHSSDLAGSPCKPQRLRLQFCKSATTRGFKTWGYA